MPLRPPNAGPLGGILTTGPGIIRGSGGPLLRPLMLVNITETEQSYGPWTITLAACAATSGIPPAGAPPGLPLDNYIITSLLERALLLKWGAGGASDQVLLDYPWSGGTFTVHAGQVSLQTVDRQTAVLPAPPNVFPSVAAWCTPGVRSGSGLQLTCTHFVGAAANTASFVPVYKHARAYMLTAAAAAVDDLRTMTKVVAQLDAATNSVLSLDRSVVGGAVWSPSTPAQLWTPLMPGATALQLGATGLGLGLDRDVRVVFALDVG